MREGQRPECGRRFPFPQLGIPANQRACPSMRPTLLLVFALAACFTFPVQAAPTGSVTGKIPLPARPRGRIAMEKYTGTISGKVAAPAEPRAGVWLEGPGSSAGAKPPKISLPQEGYQFVHSLVVVPLHTTVEFPNNDGDFHNVYSLSRTRPFDAGRYKKSENPAPTVTFDKPGLVRLQCEIHDHMKAIILVVDSRWHTVTDAAGNFSLAGVPPGNYTLHAQFDEKAKWSLPVTITAGQAVTADFSKPSVLP